MVLLQTHRKVVGQGLHGVEKRYVLLALLPLPQVLLSDLVSPKVKSADHVLYKGETFG